MGQVREAGFFSFFFSFFYVVGRDNTDRGAWENQTSISSGSGELSELRWISATSYSPERVSLLTSWPQYQTSPYKALFLSGVQENAGPWGGFAHEQGKKIPLLVPVYQSLLVLWGRKEETPPPTHSPFFSELLLTWSAP